jgi:hypothetical protein
VTPSRWARANRGPKGGFLEPGFAQAVEEVVDAGSARIEAGENLLDEGEVRVELPQGGNGRLRFIDAAELAEPGGDVTKPRRPVAIEPPGAATDLDRFFVMAELVMAAGERREPDEEPRILRA